MSAIDDLSKVAKVLREADKIEQYQLILSTQQQLIDMQKHIAELEAKINELAEQLNISHELSYEKDVYWRTKAGSEDGPYCPRCWDVDRKLVHLSNTRTGFYYCNQDKSSYEI